MAKRDIILGAGITGLTAGFKSGLPVYEAESHPGGICASYSVSPGSAKAVISERLDKASYKFSIGGGHWIFGSDGECEKIIKGFSPVMSIERRSAVFFPDKRRYAAYPIQNNVRDLGKGLADKVAGELKAVSVPAEARTMEDWMKARFGPTLFKIFFAPFHERYTAGLYKTIAPQDLYKTPTGPGKTTSVNGGAREQRGKAGVGYNASFIEPKRGLSSLVYGLSAGCRVHLNKRVTGIDLKSRVVTFGDGDSVEYGKVISTLPLNNVLRMAGLEEKTPLKDPYTSVLVLNVGAVRGPRCPGEHWIYIPKSRSGFFRVGFYSNVSPSFLPSGCKSGDGRVSIYVERAFPGGGRPGDEEIARYSASVTKELKGWGFIDRVEVVHPTWIDVAYTWSWPGSEWRERSIAMLARHGIHQAGRYGLWRFQGIAESMKQGLSSVA